MSPGPVRDLAGFASALRRRGLRVTPDQTRDMATALLLVDPANPQQVHSAFRCLTVNDRTERVPFDEEFMAFFGRGTAGEPESPQTKETGASTASRPLFETAGGGDEQDADDPTGASAVERLGDRDFSTLDDDELIAARQLVANMVWQPSDFRTRRWRGSRHGRRPDMRRTLHEAVGPTGDLLRMEMRDRKEKQRPLIVIADISGSMEKYADLFLVFAHAATRRLRHVETFTFSTDLTRITEELNRRDSREALARVTESVPDWSGGTQIGVSFARWNRAWSRRLSRGGPVVLILSDGWDCGDPDLLRTEMGRLSRSAHRVIWLNPLAASGSYEPVTRGMQAALPHVDHLLPAASVNHLKDVVSLLESINGTRHT